MVPLGWSLFICRVCAHNDFAATTSHNHMNDHYKAKNAFTCEGPAVSGTFASHPPMPKSSETMMFKTSISMFVGMWTIKASILFRKLDKLINNGVCENLTKQWRMDNVMSTMTMVEVKCQTFQTWHFICSKHRKTPLASKHCSMSSGVTFSATRPGHWSPANDARLWLHAIFISTNENRMAWKMWRFGIPSSINSLGLGDLFGHGLHKACHLPVRWSKRPRSNSSKRVFFRLKLCSVVQSFHLLVATVTSSATVETLNTQTSFISVSNSFLKSWKHEQACALKTNQDFQVSWKWCA